MFSLLYINLSKIKHLFLRCDNEYYTRIFNTRQEVKLSNFELEGGVYLILGLILQSGAVSNMMSIWDF